MRRVVSVWLPYWPIERMRAAEKRERRNDLQPPDETLPFVLSIEGTHGLEIHALNRAAEHEGLRRGQPLAEARARQADLLVRPAEPEADARALKRLALWALRFSPFVAVQGADGILIETTGAAHLFGGEDALLATIERELARLGFTARTAMAPTIGAAYALARHHPAREAGARIAKSADLRQTLGDLSPAALRLAPRTLLTLTRFGLKTIASLYGLPRASLARRFQSIEASEQVLFRLDQALGVRDEPLSPLLPPPRYRAHLPCPEPIATSEGIETGLAQLARALGADLEEETQGARALSLTLFRVDGETWRIAVRTSAPARAPSHLARLFKEKLDRIDPGFGIDLMILAADRTEPMPRAQTSLARNAPSGHGEEALAQLIDTLSGRLGETALVRLQPQESHIPERAERAAPALHTQVDKKTPATSPDGPARPFRLFDSPEPITVIAEVPDGPPLRFTWRRLSHDVARARGPERIAPEWWRDSQGVEPIRDYYEVEDRHGRRFWVFRAGLYAEAGERGPPRWYVHGLFG